MTETDPMTAQEITVTAGFCVMVTAALVGNTLVCLVVLPNRNMQTPMNYLLCNLAIADMTVAIFVSPQFIFSRAFVHPEGTTGRWLCRFITGGRLLWVGAVASSLSLVSIAFERYFAVTRPLTVRNVITKVKVRIITVCCWLIAFLWNLPSFIFIDYDKELNYCFWAFPIESLQQGYYVGCVIIAGAMPIGIMCFLYSKVIYVLWIKRSRDQLSSSQLLIVKTRQRVTKIVITVTIIYSLCWLPNLIIQITDSLGSTGHQISIILVTLNSSVNPVVYTLKSEPFRKHLRNLLGLGKKSQVHRHRPAQHVINKHVGHKQRGNN